MAHLRYSHTHRTGPSVQLQVRRAPSAEDVAAAFFLLESDPDAECELTLPASFTSKLPLDYGDYLQLILTWGARPGLKTLRVHAHDPEGARAQLKGDHIQIAAALADRIVDLARADVTTDAVRETEQRLRSKRVIQPQSAGVRAPIEQSIIEMSRFPELSMSPDLTAPDRTGALKVGTEARSLYGWVWPSGRFDTLLPNARLGEVVVSDVQHKHIERRRWPDGHPYLSVPGRKVPFRTLAERLVAIQPSARSRTRESTARPNRAEDDLGSALFELAQNAHTHGGMNVMGTPADAQTRVVRTSTRRFDRTDCVEVAKSDPALAGWMTRQLDRISSNSCEMAVIDVIDNGIGLARRAASLLGKYDEFDDEQEMTFLMQALSKSTRQGNLRMSAEGFARVQLLMTNLGGAVSIRTGRISLFRDFLDRPYKPPVKDLFVEWIPSKNASNGPHRRGTVVTIIIPTR